MTSVNVPSSGSDNEANVEPDMTQTPGSFEATQDSVVLSVGQQLRAAREARGLTADDVAKAIKLSFRQVKALEADDWPNLPGKTIIRGFVRNYARLLNLNSDQLMTELDRLHMPQAPELDIPTGPTVNLQNDGKTDRRDFFRLFCPISSFRRICGNQPSPHSNRPLNPARLSSRKSVRLPHPGQRRPWQYPFLSLRLLLRLQRFLLRARQRHHRLILRLFPP